MVGHICSHSSLVAAGYYEAADVLMITPSSTHPRVTEEGRRNVFRLTGRDDDQGRLAGDLLAVACAGRRIAILHDDSTYGVGLAGEMRKRLRANGVEEVLFESYAPNQEHYTELGKRLNWLKADVIYVGGYGPDAARILRSAREAGSDLRMIGGDGIGMDEFWTVAQPVGEGTIFSERPQAEPGSSDVEDVLAQFEARGLGSRTGGLGAYAAVQAWALAVDRIDSVATAEVARLLRRGHFETVLGRIGFDQKGDLEGAGWSWYVWSEGTHRPLNAPADQFYLHQLCS